MDSYFKINLILAVTIIVVNDNWRSKMLFIRFASQIAFLKCLNKETVERFLLNKLNGKSENYREAVSEGDECSTVVFLKPKENIGDDLSGENVIILDREVRYVMEELLNWPGRSAIEKFELSPSIILMRFIEDWTKIYDELKERYNAISMDFHRAIQLDGEGNTIVALTKKSLHSRIGPDDLMNPPIVAGISPSELYRDLKDDVLIYLSKSTGDKNWYELSISIYSKEGDYKFHYERVSQVLNELEVGLLLHEGWTVDHPFVLVTVAVYQLTFLSIFDPIEIKKILLGLEYNKEGKRVVDLDLYHKKKKISWTEKEIKKYGKDRKEVGLHFRNELIKKLPEITVKRYLDLS